jgi:hypothetical protein
VSPIYEIANITQVTFRTKSNCDINPKVIWKMPPSGISRRVALVETDVSEENITSIIRVTRIGELWTTSAVISNRRRLRRNRLTLFLVHRFFVTLMIEALGSSETPVLTRAI